MTLPVSPVAQSFLRLNNCFPPYAKTHENPYK